MPTAAPLLMLAAWPVDVRLSARLQAAAILAVEVVASVLAVSVLPASMTGFPLKGPRPIGPFPPALQATETP